MSALPTKKQMRGFGSQSFGLRLPTPIAKRVIEMAEIELRSPSSMLAALVMWELEALIKVGRIKPIELPKGRAS